jgi:hypothetical protein
VFDTDPLLCDRCGGRMKMIAIVVQASQIRQILAHVGLPVEAPKKHAARGPPQSDLSANAPATQWEPSAHYPDPADQDQSLQW